MNARFSQSLAAPLAAVLSLFCAAPALAATFTVINTADDGPGSLREAVDDANTAAGADLIDFNLGGGLHTIRLTSGEIVIEDDLTIDGPDSPSDRISISGDADASGSPTSGDSRVFSVNSTSATLLDLSLRDGYEELDGGGGINASSATLTLERCTIANCSGSGDGGGIDALVSILNLTGVLIENCTAPSGGAIWSGGGASYLTECVIVGNLAAGSSGTTETGGGIGFWLNVATIDSCIFSDNRAGYGGGIYAISSGAEIRDSTFHNNSSEIAGGGMLFVPALTPLQIINSTISNNASKGSGGGISVYYANPPQLPMQVINSTITANIADSDNDGFGGGGGISLDSTGEPIQLANTVVAGNFDTFVTVGNDGVDALEPDVILSGLGAIGTNNLIGIGDGQSSFVDGVDDNQVGTNATPLDPLLGPLADNGGSTLTHATVSDASPLLDAGDSSLVVAPDFDGPPFSDQTGAPRITGAAVDIGSVESAGTMLVTNTNDSGPGSLRAAVDALGSSGGRVAFEQSLFHAAPQQGILLTSGQITIDGPVVIDGPRQGVAISSNNNSRIFDITDSGGGTVELRNLGLLNASTTGDGGAIRVQGANTEVLIRSCGTRDCTAGQRGGALFVDGATVTCVNSTFSINGAAGNGGGIHVRGGATFSSLQSTVSGNSSGRHGGGVFILDSTATLLSSTITANTCDADAGGSAGDGGGIRRPSGSGVVEVGNCIIGGNSDLTPSAPDVSGEFVSLGHNLISRANGLTLGSGTPFMDGVNGDIVGTAAAPVDPQLDVLQVGDDFTRLHPPLAGSPVIDAGGNGLMNHPAWLKPVNLDQRGQFRVLGGTVDIGSVEGATQQIVILEVADAALSEFDGDTGAIKLTRSFDTGDLDVSLQLGSASTAGGADLDAAISPTVIIPDGRHSITVTFGAVLDGLEEGDETLVLELVDTPDYDLDPALGASATLTIADGDFIVTNNNDSGPGSLRDTIAEAESFGGGSVLIPPSIGTIALTSGQLEITEAITIEGNGTTVDAGGNSRVLEITSSGIGWVILNDLTITGGATTGSADGAGINVSGYPTWLEINGCDITDNHSSSQGGGISNFYATITIRRTAIHGNTAISGGGIDDELGILTLVNCTVANNSTTSGAAGIFTLVSRSVEIYNSTITGNIADSDGDGLGRAGGIFANPQIGGVELYNTIVAGNFGAAASFDPQAHPDIYGSFRSLGGNLIGDNTGDELEFPDGSPNANGDFVGTAATPLDPLLIEAPGSEPLHFLSLPGSLAHNGGDDANVTAPPFDPALVDQRGEPRFLGAAVDIGSIEFDPTLTSVVVLDADATETKDADLNGAVRVVRDRTGESLDVALAIVDQSGSAGWGDFVLSTVAGGSGSVSQNGSGATVRFQVGVGEVLLRVTPVDDIESEANELLRLTTVLNALSAPDPNANETDITIHDNDFTVTNYADSGLGSLRFAVIRANALDDAVVQFDNTGIAGFPRPQTVNLASPLNITGDVILCGPADNARGVTLSGGGATGILEVSGSAHLTLKQLTLRDGFADGGAMRLVDSANATLLACTFQDNHSPFNGGAINAVSTGTLFAENCTFSGNTADSNGGAIRLLNTDATFASSTFTNNTADADLDNTGDGGGIAVNFGASATLQNTIVAGNSAHAGADASGTLTSDGGNLIGSDDGITITLDTTDQAGTAAAPLDPVLEPLANNGGPVATHALLVGSPALDAGVALDLPSNDARNLPRSFGSAPDIGAYEHQYVAYSFWSDCTFPAGPPSATYDLAADHDGDGYANVFEFIAATDPTDRDDAPEIKLGRTGAGINIEITRSELVDPDHVFATRTNNLTHYIDTSIFETNLGANGPNTRKIRFSTATSGFERLFLRLDYDDGQ